MAKTLKVCTFVPDKQVSANSADQCQTAPP